MLSPEDFHAAGQILADEAQPEGLRAQAEQGRELTEAEVRRITMAAIGQASEDYPYPDVEAASAQADYEHDERTSTREGRVGSMVEDFEQRAQESDPLSQEHVDSLAERMEGEGDDAGRARRELMGHEVTGEVEM